MINIPNIISLIRLFLVPLIIFFLLDQNYSHALLVFIIAGLSDLLDGMLARLMNLDTVLGRYLDPIADKVLLVAVFVTLGFKTLIPSWLVITVVFREVLIVGGLLLSIILNGHTKEIKPLLISKINTFVQILLVILVLSKASFDLTIDVLVYYLIAICATTTITSCVMYVYKWISSDFQNRE